MKIVKAAAVQLSPVFYSREGTVEKVVRKIHELHQPGVQFATFPGDRRALLPVLFIRPDPLQNIVGPEQQKLLDHAATVPSPATDAISEAARQAGIVVSIGVNERDGGTLYNTLLLDADGAFILSVTSSIRLLRSWLCSISSNLNQECRKLVICPKGGLSWVIPSAELRELCSGSELAREAHLSSVSRVKKLAKWVVEGRILWLGPDHFDEKAAVFVSRPLTLAQRFASPARNQQAKRRWLSVRCKRGLEGARMLPKRPSNKKSSALRQPNLTKPAASVMGLVVDQLPFAKETSPVFNY